MGGVRSAVVVGGSIGGLSCALALRRAGVDVTVLEQRAEGAASGAGLALWPPALAVLAQLGLLDALTERSQPLGGLAISTSGGRLLRRLPAPRTEPLAPRMATRAALLGVLRDAAAATPGITLRHGTRSTSHVDEGDRVVVRTSSGDPLEADLLVAADGIHSPVAPGFGAPPLRYSGRTSFRGLASGVTLPFSAWEVWAVGRRMGLFDLGGGRVYYYLADNGPAGVEVPVDRRIAHLRALTKDWPAAVTAVVDATDVNDIVQTDLWARDPFRGWARGRVVLLGDAAHPMTPDIGQGACQAIEDAGSLGHHVARATSVFDALAAYERHRAPRAASMQRAAWRTGWLRQLGSPLLVSLRNLVVAWTPLLGFLASRIAEQRPPVLALPAPPPSVHAGDDS